MIDGSPAQELKWLPMPPDLWIPAELKDFEIGWFVNLLVASTRSETPGYLPLTRELWRFAGAHDGRFFRKESARVMARFEIRQLGRQEVLYFPPLVASIQTARKRLQAYRARGKGVISSASPGESGGGIAFTLPLVFDVDLDSRKEKDSCAKKPPAEVSVTRSNGYSQKDFDERDRRKLEEKLAEVHRGYEGRWIVDEDPAPAGALSRLAILAEACKRAGITLPRGESLLKKQEALA